MALLVGLGQGLGRVTSAHMVRYRDVAYVLPWVMQVALFATPVAYSLLDDAVMDTGAVRANDNRGRHTTVAAQLLRLPGEGWLKLGNVPTASSNRSVTVTDPTPGSGRIYRVRTPQLP